MVLFHASCEVFLGMIPSSVLEPKPSWLAGLPVPTGAARNSEWSGNLYVSW